MKYVKTKYIEGKLKEQGIKYANPNSRILTVAKRQGIKPAKKVGKTNYWNLGDARKMIDYISEGYGKQGRKTGSRKKKVKEAGLIKEFRKLSLDHLNLKVNYELAKEIMKKQAETIEMQNKIIEDYRHEGLFRRIFRRRK